MMRDSSNTTGLLEIALGLHRRGLRLVPLVGKRAVVKDWPSLRLRERDIRSWSRRGINWGILTGDPLVVLDTDSEAAEAWVREQGIESPVTVRTGGGGLHRYFRCPRGVEIRSRSAMHGIPGLDVKGWHGYVVAAGSVHPETGRRYAHVPGGEFAGLNELPRFELRWVEEDRPEPVRTARPPGSRPKTVGHVRDVRAYIRGIRSVEHHDGDRACFRVACLVAEAGIGFDEALAALAEWNRTNACPPWESAELERKLCYAFDRVARAA
jgi:Bifunctional DNA primase/polymerase, N-terminal